MPDRLHLLEKTIILVCIFYMLLSIDSSISLHEYLLVLNKHQILDFSNLTFVFLTVIVSDALQLD